MAKNTMMNTGAVPLPISKGGTGQLKKNFPAMWCFCDASTTIYSQYNVSSVTDLGSYQYRFNFTSALSEGEGNIFFACQESTFTFAYSVIKVSAQSSTSCTVNSIVPDYISVVGYQCV